MWRKKIYTCKHTGMLTLVQSKCTKEQMLKQNVYYMLCLCVTIQKKQQKKINCENITTYLLQNSRRISAQNSLTSA